MKFFKPHEEQAIVTAIQEAEKMTSGEIRVHLLNRIKKSIFEDAVEAFENLGMTQTSRRNGVLIAIAPKYHEFAVLGDRGIHEKVDPDFWIKVRDVMKDDFQRQDFLKGILDGIQMCGQELARCFPRTKMDKNELPDHIS